MKKERKGMTGVAVEDSKCQNCGEKTLDKKGEPDKGQEKEEVEKVSFAYNRGVRSGDISRRRLRSQEQKGETMEGSREEI